MPRRPSHQQQNNNHHRQQQSSQQQQQQRHHHRRMEVQQQPAPPRNLWGNPLPLLTASTENTTSSNPSMGMRTTRSSHVSSGVSGLSGLSSVHLEDTDDNDVDAREDAQRAALARVVAQKITKHRQQRKSLLKAITRSKPTLNLSGLGISTLEGEAVKQMVDCQVEKVTLANNEAMVIVPEALVQAKPQLSSLKWLDLSKCQIMLLPERWDLPNLEALNLSHNRIKDFPSKSMLKGIPKIQDLNLYGNRLTRLPDFSYVVAAANAAASGADFQEAPQVVSSRRTSSASTTNTGNATQSSLEQRRRSFLTNLQVLNVGYNDVTYLPPYFPPSLRVLIACNNFLSQVPSTLVLSAPEDVLREVDVSSNPMEFPPASVCDGGLRSMRKFFQAEARKQQQQRYDGGGGSARASRHRGSTSSNPRGVWKEELEDNMTEEPQVGRHGDNKLERIPSYNSRLSYKTPHESGAIVPEVIEFALPSSSRSKLST